MLNRLLATALLVPCSFAALHAADTYDLDLENGHVAAVFKVKHFGVSYTHGRFNDIRGTIVYDAANPAASKVDVTIKADSVDTFNKKRDDHLRNPDFFDAKQFPVLTFVSKEFKKHADNVYHVTGDFTMHGVTKTLTIPVEKIGEGKDPWGGHRIGFDASFTVKRSEYGMTKMLEGVGDDVFITVSLEGVKRK
jgi:polyisoprenoid-binding protein YceI